MEKIIKKAIEGGYALEFGKDNNSLGAFLLSDISQKRLMYYSVLDPIFWQALGKACKWEKETEEIAWMDKGAYRDSSIIDGFYNAIWELETWKFHAIRFHKINLTEGWDKAVEYLSNLTQPPITA